MSMAINVIQEEHQVVVDFPKPGWAVCFWPGHGEEEKLADGNGDFEARHRSAD
jgi:hypothetical protein